MRYIFSFIVVAAAALAACGEPGAPAADKTPATAPTTLLLAPEDVLTVQPSQQAAGPVISGSIQPGRRADLRAEVAAVVMQILKDNGERVRSGDLLVRLDDTALRDQLASAEEAVRAATRAHEQAERQVERLGTLKQQGMVSTQAVEDAELRRNAAQSELAAARARVVSARQQLQRTLVRAPFDGVVSERKASVGDTVQVGKELLKVIDPASMRFEGAVSADQLQVLEVGQPVRFRVNGFGQDQEFAGRVRRIDPSANATTRQVEVTVAFADTEQAPRVAGLFAEGRIETGRTQALMLPESAIVRGGPVIFVWRIDGRTLAKAPVRLGERDARTGDWPVLEGLKPGDRILRHPSSTLVDGQALEFAAPVPAGAAAAVVAK